MAPPLKKSVGENLWVYVQLAGLAVCDVLRFGLATGSGWSQHGGRSLKLSKVLSICAEVDKQQGCGWRWVGGGAHIGD